ncbi:MAG: iron hydrogenase small subunit [Clostridia bacterium]|nr:iron hydrogenase small subunit [Clostridia bacterium]
MAIFVEVDENNPSIVRDASKCVYCGMCKKTCKVPVCINCGQCANFCPPEAITEKKDFDKIREIIKNTDKVVIFNTAPAVRVALGEEFSGEDGEYVEGKMVTAIRKLGVDYVFDVTFGADLTIVEEAAELVHRIKNGGVLPQFTSCCPSWVKFVEMYYPEFRKNLSTAKSPISMQTATIKTYFANLKNIDPRNIITVAVAPCTAKKYEVQREELSDASKFNKMEHYQDTDYVITTRELAEWIKEENIDFYSLEESNFDDVMGKGTGAGVIFGNTGGVMEAALRTAYYYITGENLPNDKLEFHEVRGMESVKEASIDINGLEVKVAIAHGIDNARALLEKIKAGEVTYHFVEVMNCVGGCISGGGQPKITLLKLKETRLKRIASLYSEDERLTKRLSHENPEIKELYENFYKEPLSEISEQLLHTEYFDKSNLLEGKV